MSNTKRVKIAFSSDLTEEELEQFIEEFLDVLDLPVGTRVEVEITNGN